MILGTIDTVDDDNGLCLIIDGEDAPTTKKYTYLASYVPAEDDRVIIEEISGSYVILGKIITETSESGIVNFATNATNAANATNADNATNATNAVTAQTAVNATTADSATTATTATNATNSSNADKAGQIKIGYKYDSLGGAVSGKLVYRVSREYDSTLGKYIVTDVQLSENYSRNYVYE